MIRRLFLYFILLVVFSGAMFVLSIIPTETSSRQVMPTVENPSSQEILKRVRLMKVITLPLTETIRVPGTLDAMEDVTLGTGISGILERIHVAEGDFVKKGQVLFQIDKRSRESMLTEARAAHELAKRLWNVIRNCESVEM